MYTFIYTYMYVYNYIVAIIVNKSHLYICKIFDIYIYNIY